MLIEAGKVEEMAVLGSAGLIFTGVSAAAGLLLATLIVFDTAMQRWYICHCCCNVVAILNAVAWCCNNGSASCCKSSARATDF